MASQLNLKPSTLYTYGNKLTTQDGNLIIADNCVIDQPDAIESRRGFFEYSQALESTTSVVNQLMEYKGRLIGHIPGADALYFDSATPGNFQKFDGTYTAVSTGVRLRSQEANGNFYFTTNDGIKKISVTSANDFSTAAGFVSFAGAPRATDLEVTVNRTTPGFLTVNSAVAYRVLFGTRDANDNLILGTPSDRVILATDGTSFLLQDFNNLLTALDTAANSSTADLLSSTDYFSVLNLSSDATAEELRSGLISLAQKLDNDFAITDAVSAVSASTTGTLAEIYFNGAVSGNYFKLGDHIALSNFSTPAALTAFNSTTANPSWQIVGFGSASSIQFGLDASSTASIAATSVNSGAVVKSYNFQNIEAPTATIIGQPNGSQYQTLVDYYTSILQQIQEANSGWIESSLQPVGNSVIQDVQANVIFSVPGQITTANYTSWFYRIYRTAVTQVSSGITLQDVDPGDEEALIQESPLTLADVTAMSVTVVDNTPDSFRGVPLYTNANSGEGILQTNDQPPVAKDIATYRNVTFYANTKNKQQTNLTLLGTSNLSSAITGASLTAASLASSAITLVFNSTVTGFIASSSVIALTGFSGTSETINGPWAVSSVSGSTAVLSAPISGSFSDTTTANFGVPIVSQSISIGTEAYKFVPIAKEEYRLDFGSPSGLSSGSTASYFTLNSAENATPYYVWFSVGSATADPAPSGLTGIKVSAATSDAASTFAQYTLNAIKNVMDFNSPNTSVTGSTGYVQLVDYGLATDPVFVGAITGAVTATTIQQGFLEDATLGWVGLATEGTPSQNIFDTSKSFLRTVNKRPSGAYAGFYLSGLSDTPGKMQITAKNLSTTTFSLNASSVGTGQSFDPELPTTGTTVNSSNVAIKNRLYYSKISQPEAVPSLVNYVDVGQQDKAILRILPLRDSLFILKEDGLYRLGGDTPSNFSVFLADISAKLLASDSAVSLNNQIYCWTTQGIVTITDGGVDIISRPVENLLNKLVNITNYNTIAHACNYDLDRAYLIWLPENEGDSTAPQCLRYNYITRAWTRWPIQKDSALVLSSDNKLYLGAGDENYIEKERKDYDRIDYADREFQVTVGPNSVFGSTYFLSSIANIERDDVIAQQQYVTLVDYNQLLNKLDIDPGVMSASADNYTAALSADVGASIQQKIVGLAQKLDSDFGFSLASSTAITTMSDAAPSSMQVGYNFITTTLNSSTAFTYNNYHNLTSYRFFESVLDTVSFSQVSVVSSIALPIIQGPVIIYKHIVCDAQWVPQHMGDPASLKHIRECSLMFESSNFKRARVGFGSDLLPGFETVEFNMEGDGIWGYNSYGSGFYGGGGNQRPLRTYVPAQKQRCRFANVKFTHQVARSKWTLYGLNLVGEQAAVEKRAYR